MKRRKKKKTKVLKYKKRRVPNIGLIVFVAIFAYITIYMVMYFTRDRVSIYEVVYGKNADVTNKTYTALILRDETNVMAETSGYINYYIKSGERVAVGETVYSLDESGKIQEYLADYAETLELTEGDYEQIRQYISDFTANYSDNDFSSVYDFKIDLSSLLLEFANMNAINEKLTEFAGTEGYNYTINQSTKSGIVEYYNDGYEGKLVTDINASDFDNTDYKRKTNTAGSLVEAGTPAYKVINAEQWHVLIPLSADEAAARAEDTRMKIKFTEDGTTVVGDFSVITQNDCTFGMVTLDKYMIEYASQRYSEIQIVEDEVEGLKIPKTSIVKKNFFVVPKNFSVIGGDSDETGFSKEVVDENNQKTIKFIAPEIYYADEENYYIDDENIKKGDILIKNESTETFTIGQTSSLEGVFNVNNGYCVFRRIEKLSESGDYFLVRTNTSYGLKVYDHIVIDGSMVKEDAVVFR